MPKPGSVARTLVLAHLFKILSAKGLTDQLDRSALEKQGGTAVALSFGTCNIRDRAHGRRGSMRIEDVLQRIQGEFVEMPGLRLTAAQAQRLWGLDKNVCEQLLSVLVDAKFLSQTRDGSFIRTDGGPTRVAPRSAA